MSNSATPHLALFPCAGMGHLIPFLRLAADLHSRGGAATIITVDATVSSAESDYLSDFFATFPLVKRLDFQLLPHKKSQLINQDPFFIHTERMSNSVHLLQPMLSSLYPPLSALVVDLPILTRLLHLRLSLPVYTLITSSARFFCLMTSLSHLPSPINDCIQIPNLGSVPVSSIPPPMLDPNHYFSAMIITNTQLLQSTKGVLINTFASLEPEAVEALRANGVGNVLPVGPLPPFERPKTVILHQLTWLDEQAAESVVYISFGSRTALSKAQMREVAGALEISGCKFLWVVKGRDVDKEDDEEVDEMVGEAFVKKTEGQGKVVKGWVEQERILAHPAIGGFVSHCGWNSITEAAALGVPVLAWPTHGDQRVNAEVVQRAGLGLWDRDWGWEAGGGRLIGREEISNKLRAVIGDAKLRATAKEIKEQARRAREECLLQLELN